MNIERKINQMAEGSDRPPLSELNVDTAKLNQPAAPTAVPRAEVAGAEFMANVLRDAAQKNGIEIDVNVRPTRSEAQPAAQPVAELSPYLDLAKQYRLEEDEARKAEIARQMNAYADAQPVPEPLPSIPYAPLEDTTGQTLKLVSKHLNVTPELVAELKDITEAELTERLNAADAIGDTEDANRIAAMIILKKSGIKVGPGVETVIQEFNQENEANGKPQRAKLIRDRQGRPIVKDGKPVMQFYNIETGLNEGQLTYESIGRPNQLESKNQSNMIPEDKTANEVIEWLDDYIRRAETSAEGFSPEEIAKVRSALTEYETDGDEISLEILDREITLLEVRGMLKICELQLNGTQNYEMAGGLINQYMDEKHLRALWYEDFGSGEKVIQELAKLMDKDKGAYWREGPAGSHRVDVDNYLADLRSRGVLDNERDLYLLKPLVESIFNATGMISFYTGPRDPATGLPVELSIMESVNPTHGIKHRSSPPLDDTEDGRRKLQDANADSRKSADLIYGKNEVFWKEWLKWRKKNLPRRNPGDVFCEGRGRGSGLSRLMYMPEEQVRLNNTKARSLWPAGEMYLRALPVMNGFDSLSDFINNFSNPPTINPDNGLEEINRPGLDMSYQWFRYGGAITKAGALFAPMAKLMDAPIIGGAAAWDLKDLGSNLKNVTEVVGKFDYLKAGAADNMPKYAVEKLVENVFKYLNDDSYDRLREFGAVPKASKPLMNTIINLPFFADLMDNEHKQQLLNDLGSWNWLINTYKVIKSDRDYFFDLIKDFFKRLGVKT